MPRAIHHSKNKEVVRKGTPSHRLEVRDRLCNCFVRNTNLVPKQFVQESREHWLPHFRESECFDPFCRQKSWQDDAVKRISVRKLRMPSKKPWCDRGVFTIDSVKSATDELLVSQFADSPMVRAGVPQTPRCVAVTA